MATTTAATLRPPVHDYDDPRSPFEPTVLGAAWRYWWLVALSVVLFAVLAVAVSMQLPDRWSAEASLVVEDPRAAALFEQATQDEERYLENQIAILRSPSVAAQASDALGGAPTQRELLKNTAISGDSDSDFVRIVYTAEDPELALAATNAIAVAYQDVRRSEAVRSFGTAVAELNTSIADIDAELIAIQARIAELQQSDPTRRQLSQQYDEALDELATLQASLVPADPEVLADLQRRLELTELVLKIEAQQPELAALLEEQRQAVDRLSDLTTRKDQLEVEIELVGGGVVFYSPAQEATSANFSSARIGVVGVVLGGLIGAAGAYGLAWRRRNFDNRGEPELVLGVPLLAEVPDFREERVRSEVPTRDEPATAVAEAVRFVSAVLSIRMGGKAGKPGTPDATDAPLGAVSVVSARFGEGKSVLVANIAVAAANQGKKVLVIDADFGHQSVTDKLCNGRQPSAGITEVAFSMVPLSRALVEVSLPRGSQLWVLSRGNLPVTAPDFFSSPETRELLTTLDDSFDLILIDTPPLLQVAYASTLVSYSDGVVVVVPHGSSIPRLADVAKRLELIGTRVAGYIYNRAPGKGGLLPGEGSMADVLGSGTVNQVRSSSGRRPRAPKPKRRTLRSR